MSRGPKEFLRFAAVGAGGFLVDVAAFLAMLATGSDVYIARAVSAFLAITATWWLNREWTFRQGEVRHGLKTYPSYIVVQSGGMAVNYLVFALVQTLLAGGLVQSLVAFTSGSAAALAINYAGARGIVFRRQS